MANLFANETRYAKSTQLARKRTHRNQDKNGLFRWYNDYALPDEYGGGTITVRLHGDESDAARKFNRTENIRPIAPTDPDFKKIYARRNDSESINRSLDDTLWLTRAHSIGHVRQTVNLLGYALTNGERPHLARTQATACGRASGLAACLPGRHPLPCRLRIASRCSTRSSLRVDRNRSRR